LAARLLWLYLAAEVVLWLLLRYGSDDWWPVTMRLFGPRWLAAVPLIVLLPAAVLARSRRAAVLLAAAVLIVAGPITGGKVHCGCGNSSPRAGRRLTAADAASDGAFGFAR
jgi:vancomycin resistance protein VanJ